MRRWWAWIEVWKLRPSVERARCVCSTVKIGCAETWSSVLRLCLEEAGVELGVVGELLGARERRRVVGHGRAQAVEVRLRPSRCGESRGWNLDELTRLQQLLERDVPRLGQQCDVRLDEGGDVIDRGQRDEAATGRPLRRTDEPLCREHAQRLADRCPADAELPGERRLDRQPLARGELPRDDQLAELVGDLLVRLSHPPHGHAGHGRDCP